MKRVWILSMASLLGTQLANAADLSPGKWPKAERERLEQLESQSWSPLQAGSVAGDSGLISATVSPIAVHAGLEALRQGGTAADALGQSTPSQPITHRTPRHREFERIMGQQGNRRKVGPPRGNDID